MDIGSVLNSYSNPQIAGYVAEKQFATRGADFLAAAGKVYGDGAIGASNFKDAFPQYKVTTHVGNTDVSSANWQRNDFPFWEYFNESTSADSLNEWKPTGPNPPQTDSRIQRHASQIGPGKMAILIPESLQKKMDADENYAREIMAKVHQWKEDYDRMDNALAASYGYNVAEHQFSKSYCIQLDENGDVKEATITGGGGEIIGPSKKELEQIEAEKKAKRKKEAEYLEMLEESAMKRRLQEQETNKRNYKSQIAMDTAVTSYQSNFLISNMNNLL